MNFPLWVVVVYIPTVVVFAMYLSFQQLWLKERRKRIAEGREWAARVRRLEDKAQALRELPLPPLPKIAVQAREMN